MATRALVVGGTGGIGYAIAVRVAGQSPSSSVIISGRTKPKDIPHPNIEFSQLDASSMRSIKKYTDAFKATQPQPLDLLVLSQGILTTAGRTETAEGIDNKMALHYYGRQLLIRELLPVLNKDAKVLIVLDGTRGRGPTQIDWDDLELKKTYTVSNAANHCITMTDAMIQAYAANQKEENSGTRHFIHAHPGIVKTNLFGSLPWYLRSPAWAMSQVFGTAPDTCAEHLLKGTQDVSAEGKTGEKFWNCIDHHGHLVRNKPVWSEEKIKAIEDHTWKVVDGAINLS